MAVAVKQHAAAPIAQRPNLNPSNIPHIPIPNPIPNPIPDPNQARRRRTAHAAPPPKHGRAVTAAPRLVRVRDRVRDRVRVRARARGKVRAKVRVRATVKGKD